jgi:aminopeptidase N
MDKDTSRSGIPLKNLMPLAQQAVNALNIYRELFGVDYPHGKLDLVNAPQGLSAQAPDSIVYVGTPAFRGSSASLFVDTLIAHEVAHQWWGGVVGNKNRRHYWFIESLAEYASAIFYEIVESDGYAKPEKARKAYLKIVDGWREEILRTDLLNSVQNSEVAYLGEFRGYARHALVYAKGPYAFHILRETFGDERFFAFLKKLAQELAGQSIVTRDIQRIAEESFGGTMEWFFDQWIRGVGIPEYAFDYDVRQTEDGSYVIEGKITQRVVVGRERFPLEGVYYRGWVPVDVKVKTGEEFRKALIVEGLETPVGLKVPGRPVDVAFNKNGEILSWPVVVNGE